MKTFLIALLTLAGFAAAAPRAEAGQFTRIHTKHGVQYVNKFTGVDASYYRHGNSRNYHRYRSSRSHRSYRYAPYYRSYPSYRTSHYRPSSYYNSGYYGSSSCYSSRPRFSISFGF